MSQFILSAFLCLVFVGPAVGQDYQQPKSNQTKQLKIPQRTKFHNALSKAIKQRRQRGEISGIQAIKLRVALFSPAFRKRAEDLAVTQLVFSAGEPPMPLDTNGRVDRTSIDWDGLAGFLERLLPLLLQLLEFLGD